MLNLFNVEPRSLRIQLKDINDETVNDDIVDAIMRAKNALTSILYGSDETFKCSMKRIYKSQNEPIKGSNVLESSDLDVFGSWYCLNHLERL